MDPHWADDGFSNTSPRSPVLIYFAFWQWFKDNLSIEERLLIDIGDNRAWPNRQGVGDDEIRDALVFVLRAIEGMNVIHDNITATQCFHKLITKVHPDRYARGGFRVAYTSAVCTGLLYRCLMAALEHSDTMDALAMPRMLITRFSASRSITAFPPSSFEYAAARYTAIEVEMYQKLDDTPINGIKSTTITQVT